MYVTENGTYIEEADAASMTDYGDFIRFVDEHGAVILLSKDIIRAAHNLLDYLENTTFTQEKANETTDTTKENPDR